MNGSKYFADGEGSATQTVTTTGIVPGSGATGAPAAGEEKKHEPAIPYERFKEVNDKLKALEAEKAESEKKASEAATEALKKKGEWEKVASEASAKLEQAQQALKDRDIRQAAFVEAVAANAVDPEAVYQLMDKSKVTFVDGKVTGVKEAIAELLTARAYLVKTAGGTGYIMGAGGTGREPTPDDISKMSMAQYREWVKNHPNA